MNKYKAYIKYHDLMHQFEEVLEVTASSAKEACYLALGQIIDEDLSTSGHYFKFDEAYVEVVK